jgi:hypothetical protein
MDAPRTRRLVGVILTALAAAPACDGLMSGGGAGPDPGSAKTGSGAVTRQTHQSFFPIQAGAHGNADCNSCHGGLPTFKMFSCVGCHEHEQAIIDPRHAGIAGYQFDSKACLMCHPSGVAGTISRADHMKFFPIDAGTPHATGQCADCHTNPADKKQFSCVGCHDHAQAVTDPGHAGVTGYKYQSSACLMCHPSGVAGTISRADHMRFFPIDTGTKHGNQQCADCHTNPADKKVFACIGCHDHAQAVTDPKHASIVGYRYDSPSCLRCHTNGEAKFDHATLGAVPNCIGCHRDDLTKAVTTPASKHTANNFPAACESCHKSFTAWGPNTPMQHLAVGGTTSSCQTCHLANFMTAVSPFNHVVAKTSANTCNTCHTDFTTWTKFVHNPTSCFNGATGATHRKATCAQCHAVPTDYKQTSCTACHRDRGKSCNG